MFYGDVERFLADLYPWRWLILAGLLVMGAAIIGYAYTRGWHLTVRKHWMATTAVAAPLLALSVFGLWMLAAPLFNSVTVEEEFPFALNAEVPDTMTRADVEVIMEGMAKLNQPMDEAMPEMEDKDGFESGGLSEPTPTPQPGATATATPASTPAPQPTATTAAPSVVKLKSGVFAGADSFHQGRGVGTIYEGPDGSLFLRLDNFEVTNGPDLHVILSTHVNPTRSNEVMQQGYIDLGKLKGNIGNQNYFIPEGVDVSAIRSVVIYCLPFHVAFATATFQ